MVSKNRDYDPSTSPSLYQQKMARIKAGYVSPDKAYELALRQADKWNRVFDEYFAKVHHSDYTQKLKMILKTNIGTGVLVRYQNWILRNVVMTGAVGYDGYLSKMQQIFSKKDIIDEILAYTLCAMNTVAGYRDYTMSMNPKLADVLSAECGNLLTTSPDTATSVTAIVSTLASSPYPVNTKGYLYYLYPRATAIAGTQGGEKHAPPPPITAPTSIENPIEKTIQALSRLLNG